MEGDTFTPESLVASGVLKKLEYGLKIFGNGELTRKISVRAHVYSKSALAKIEAAGGTAEVIAPKVAGSKDSGRRTVICRFGRPGVRLCM